MQVTIPIYYATKKTTGFYDAAMTDKAAEIDHGDTLVLMACKIKDGPNPFKYMDAMVVYVDSADVYFMKDIVADL